MSDSMLNLRDLGGRGVLSSVYVPPPGNDVLVISLGATMPDGSRRTVRREIRGRQRVDLAAIAEELREELTEIVEVET